MTGYFGLKARSGLCQTIIAIMQPHDLYMKTNLGSGAIMVRKSPALNNIGIDLALLSLVDFACDFPVKLINECAHYVLKLPPDDFYVLYRTGLNYNFT